jgi:AcrR family transcriptional regulator
MKTRSRLDPTERKKQIIEQAMKLSESIGYKNITRGMIAAKLKISGALITKYFKNTQNLKKCVLKEAIKLEKINILAQGMGNRDSLVLKLPELLKEKVIRYIVK